MYKILIFMLAATLTSCATSARTKLVNTRYEKQEEISSVTVLQKEDKLPAS